VADALALKADEGRGILR